MIEGSRKACGEVIGLSSEEKHQAGGIIPEEFIQASAQGMCSEYFMLGEDEKIWVLYLQRMGG